MIPEERDKRMAAIISIGVHVIVFSLLAAGGMFSFLQTHSQAKPVDVTIYNEDALENTPPVGNGETSSDGGGGETYHIPQKQMPAIQESYTQAVQEEREIKKVMQHQGISKEQAKNIVTAKKQPATTTSADVKDANKENHTVSQTGPHRVEGVANEADGAAEKAGNGRGGSGNGPGNNPDAAPGLGTSSNGNAYGGDPQGSSHSQGKRPATKARLISQPDVNAYYPQELRKKNITGTVTVHVVITSDGVVSSASVSGSSGYAAMDAAAVQIAYQCRYEPARNEQGDAVAAERNLSIPFVLQ